MAFLRSNAVGGPSKALEIQGGADDFAPFMGEAIKEEAQQFREQNVDEQIELDQDAHRLARNALGVRSYVPMPNQVPVLDKANAVDNHAAQRTIPKNPVNEGRLGQFAHKGRPPVKTKKRVLLGDAPKRQVLHRPKGAHHNQGAVTVA